MKTANNQKIVYGLIFTISALVLYFSYTSVKFFIRGMQLYDELPDSEIRKLPESTFLFITFYICFAVNAFFIVVLTYCFCYVAVFTY